MKTNLIKPIILPRVLLGQTFSPRESGPASKITKLFGEISCFILLFERFGIEMIDWIYIVFDTQV